MHNKKIIIITLIITLLIMAGGYAVYSSNLKVEGTGSIDSNFNIEVTGIEEESKSGKAVSVTEPTYTSSTATFNTKLQRPGDNIEYKVEITNNGTVDGKINALTITNPSTIVKVETRGIVEGEVIKSGKVKSYIVRIYIPENVKLTEDVTSTVEVSAEIIQDDNQIFNEGIDGTLENKLEIESTKEESDYTSITATVNAKGQGLKYYYSLDNETWTEPSISKTYTFTELEPGTRYTVYYKVEDENNNYVTNSKWIETKEAIFTITYNYNGATSSNEEKTKNIMYNETYGDLPSPQKEGYIFSGWYKDVDLEEKINTGSKYKVIGDSTIYAGWIDKINPTCSLAVTNATIDSVTIKATCTDVSDISNYKLSVDDSSYSDKGTTTTYTIASYNLSTIKLMATDGVGNTGTYVMETNELEEGYAIILSVLNDKYSSVIEKKEAYKNSFLNETYPVGSIYVTTTYSFASQVENAIGGTWEVYGSGRTLVGVNTSDTNFSTVGKTGGSSTNTLAVTNVASHTHSIPALSGTAASAGAHTHSIPVLSGTAASAGSHTHSLYTWVFNGVNESGGMNKYGIEFQKTGVREIRDSVDTSLENSWGIKKAGAHTHSVTTVSNTTGSKGTHTHDVTITENTSGKLGSGTSFTNLQPYITVYMYKRIA